MADESEWRGDFESARKRFLDSSLAATPAQRLKWLEEALALAARSGALPSKENSSAQCENDPPNKPI